MDSSGHVMGTRRGHVMLYALSTCIWCKKTRALLDRLGVDYHFTYLDLVEGREQEEAMAELERWNPQGSFPTIVIDGTRAVLGFDEARIRQALGL